MAKRTATAKTKKTNDKGTDDLVVDSFEPKPVKSKSILPDGLIFDDENLSITNADGSEYANLFMGAEGFQIGTGHVLEENLRKVFQVVKNSQK